MPRLTEAERTQMMDDFRGYMPGADTQAGAPIEIEPGFGRTQFNALFDQYHDRTVANDNLETVELPGLLAERAAIWGIDADDFQKVWNVLTSYKPTVKSFLGPRHALVTTIPNMETQTPGNYLTMVHRFLRHWTSVNAAGAAPMTIGAYTLANLQTAHDTLTTKLQQIDQREHDLGFARADKEVFFGDVLALLRERTSVIARLEQYVVTITNRFGPNHPLTQTLPPIFRDGQASLPRFDFNNSTLGPGQEKTLVKDPSLPNAAVVYFKEGAFEQTQPYSATPGSTNAFTWTGVTVVDGLDAMELRDATGRTIARGTFNAGLGEV